MAEAWVNIEDNEDMIHEIVDDELILVDAIVNDENLDDADKEEEEVVLLKQARSRKLHIRMFLERLQVLNHTWLKISCQKNINY